MSSLPQQNGGELPLLDAQLSTMREPLNLDHQRVTIAVYVYWAVTVLVYFISSFFPASFLWGINHLAFVKEQERIIILLIVLILGFPPVASRYINIVERYGQLHSLSRSAFLTFILILGVIVSWFCYNNRIMTDMYGDSRTLLQLLSWNKFSLLDIFKTGDNEPLTRFIHQFIAEIFNIQFKLTYEIISSLCGGIYVGGVLFFIRHLDGSKLWKFMALILLVTAGTNQIFFGHVEDYTLVYLCIVLFFMLSWMFFKGKKTLGLMLLTFLVGTRLHMEMVLVFPSLLYAIIYNLRQKHQHLEKWLLPTKIFWIVGVSIVCCTLAYFFYFNAYRYIGGSQEEIVQKVFMPIYSDQPPPYVYSLFSINHISDCIQEILLSVSPVALLILFLSFIFLRGKILWNPVIIFSLLAVFYFLLFNFTVYPMLTMPRDWDLLSLAAVSVIFLAIAFSEQLFAHLSNKSLPKIITGVGCALGVFSFTFFYVNSSSEYASNRLEGIGKWVFKSHHNSSSYILNVSTMMVDDLNEQIKRREETIRDLLPHSLKPDLEMGFLYHKLGAAYYANRQFDQATDNLKKSTEQDPDNATALKLFAMIALQKWDFDEATRLMSFYNNNVNHPNVKDPQGFELERYCKQLKKLVSSGVDSLTIQEKLNFIFQLTRK